MSASSLHVYAAVYEHKGVLWPQFTREFLRQGGILVEQPDGKLNCFHVTGTPGIGLRYSWERGWGNPEDEPARLLAMNQNWVRDALGAMMGKGLITHAEKEKAEEEQKAIAVPFTSETPNTRALEEEAR